MKQELEIAIKDKVIRELERQRDIFRKAIMDILPDKSCPRRGMLAAALANGEPSDAYQAEMRPLLEEYEKQSQV